MNSLDYEKMMRIYKESSNKQRFFDETGIHQGNFLDILKKKKNFQLDLLIKFSNYYNIPISDLFDEGSIASSKTEELQLQLSQLKNAEEKSQQIIEEKNKHISVLEKFQTSLEAQIHDLKKDKEKLESENKVLIKNMKDREEIIHKVYDGLIELVSIGRITTKESESLLPQWRLRTLHASDVR